MSKIIKEKLTKQIHTELKLTKMYLINVYD